MRKEGQFLAMHAPSQAPAANPTKAAIARAVLAGTAVSGETPPPLPPPPRALIACTRMGRLESVGRSIGLDHRVTWQEDGWSTLERLTTEPYAFALVDTDLPGLSGYDVAKRARRRLGADCPPILLVCFGDSGRADLQVAAGDAHGALALPMADGQILERVWSAVDGRLERQWDTLNPVQRGLLKVTTRSMEKLAAMAAGSAPVEPAVMHMLSASIVEAAKSDDLVAVLDALKGHHNYTFVHALKVSAYMTMFGASVGMSQGDLETLSAAGLMHDIGKVFTPVAVLNKPGKLDEEEWVVMRQHTVKSGEFLREHMQAQDNIVHVAERHHERLDGTGYPHGLKSRELDDPSLVCAIADVYSALTDKRAYKKPMERDRALAIMDEMAGSHLERSFYYRFRQLVGDTKLAG